MKLGKRARHEMFSCFIGLQLRKVGLGERADGIQGSTLGWYPTAFQADTSIN